MPEKEAPNVVDIMSAFTHSAGSSEEEMLRLASNYALQLRPDQLECLMKLEMFAIDYGENNADLKTNIELFIDKYLKLKHFHESGYFIRSIISDLSLKRIIPPDATKVNVMKGQ